MDQSKLKRGQMSTEASVIKDAKDRVIRSGKLMFASVAARLAQGRMMKEGKSVEYRCEYLTRQCYRTHVVQGSTPPPCVKSTEGQEDGHRSSPARWFIYCAHCKWIRCVRCRPLMIALPSRLTSYLGAFISPRLSVLRDSLPATKRQAEEKERLMQRQL